MQSQTVIQVDIIEREYLPNLALGPKYAAIFLPLYLKFIYSEKATKFCKISTVDLSYVVPVKSTVEISQNFVAFSEYMNFNSK